MNAPREATAVALTGLTKIFPGASGPAVEDLTLPLPAGTLTALLGPSGCGKTTTLRLVAGLIDPDDGDITFDGRSVLGLPPERRPVALVSQKPLLFPHLSVADNVGFGLRMRHVPRRDRAARVAQMLSMVELDGFGERRVHQLSGGQEQRVALARALVTDPRVLLLDEPFSALDASLRAHMRQLLRDVQRQLAVTTLFVTHDQTEAVELAATVALVLAGRLEQHDEPRALYERPATAATARFFGATNIFPGTLDDTVFDCALGSVTVGHPAPAGAGQLVVRPEALRLTESGGPNTVAGTVARAEYRGTHTWVTVAVDLALRPGTATEGTCLHVVAPAGAQVPVGGRVGVHIPPQAATVVSPD